MLELRYRKLVLGLTYQIPFLIILHTKNKLADNTVTPTIIITCAIPTIPIPNVFPNTIVLGDVDVTNVSIILDVFSVVIEVDT